MAELVAKIKIVKEYHNMDALEYILNDMKPLIRKYTKKLFFLENEDAIQELSIALIEAVYKIKSVDNEAMCLSYLHKSVINKYNLLCKENIKIIKKIETREITEEIPLNENYDIVELYLDIQNLLKDKNETQKLIIKHIINDNFSDAEIALKVGISRQFVNKTKKQLLRNYLLNSDY